MYGIEEARMRDVQEKADRAIGRLYELDSISSHVARVEHSIEGLSACIDGLRSAVESCLYRIEQIEREIIEIREPLS